ncbi:MAG: ABC transporter ATP-binding protein [Clostridia bacterium]|nr:ABC transporter ATP-binding protein [Clostridia bacterium]
MKRHLPESVCASLKAKGASPDEAFLSIKTDMAREQVRCDAYTVWSTDGFATLFCLEAVKKKEDASFFSRTKTETVLQELDYHFISADEVESLYVEELISTLRLVARRRDGEEECLFYATPACRKRVYELTEAFEKYQKDGTVPEKRERRGEGRCPRCGTPFSDPEKRTCAKCLGKRSLVKKLLPFFWRYKLQVALVLFTVLLTGAVSVLFPYLNSRVLYDEVLKESGSYYGMILGLVLMLAGVSLLNAVINMLSTMVSSRVAAWVSYDLKKTIFAAFERLSFSFFTSRHTGRLITQVNSDAETLYWFFCDGVPYFLTNLLQMIGVGVVMLSVNPILTLVIVLPIPFVFVGYYLVLRLFRRLQAENHTRRSRFNGVLSDVLGGMRVVKAFSREETEIGRFDKTSRELAASRLEIDTKNHVIFPLLNLAMRLTSYLVWGIGGYFVLKEASSPGNGISYGELSMFVGYLAMLYNPLNFFAHFFGQMASALNSLQRLFEIMEAEPDVKEKENAVHLSSVRGEVEFKNVNFSYSPGKRTIRDVSFRVPAGQTLGIVGHTGAGKSTLANLLTRLYDAESGSILIDGVDVRDLSFATLRENVAIVSQETYLFRGTIKDNIRYARPDATDEEVLAAGLAAGCHDFVMTFPEGYNTRVGMDTKSLSGGEKQRVSIARAILKDPAILILDEATAAMDTKTERKIQSALAAITKDRTTITIAHRLSTLRDADSLIVIEEGKVVERGTHESLLKKKGVYHKLYTLQMEAMKTIGIEE